MITRTIVKNHLKLNIFNPDTWQTEEVTLTVNGNFSDERLAKEIKKTYPVYRLISVEKETEKRAMSEEDFYRYSIPVGENFESDEEV